MLKESEKSESFKPTLESLLMQNNLPKIQMKGISPPTMGSLLGNSLFLNNKSEHSESNVFNMNNSESEISSGKAATPDFSSAQSNSPIAAVYKTEKCSENESNSEFSSKESRTQNGEKTRSYASRTNRPINKSLYDFDSSLFSRSKATSTSVVKSIDYTSNSNSSYISLVESIMDENEDETTVSPNCTVTKVDSPVAKSKAY